MEFFDYFARLFGMDPTQLPVYLRIMTFIVSVVFVVFFTCLIISKVRKVIKLVRHVRQGIRVKKTHHSTLMRCERLPSAHYMPTNREDM